MRPSRRGVILALTLAVTACLVFLGTLFLDLHRAASNQSELVTDRILARHAAESGVEEARGALRADSAWTAGFDRQALSNGATFTVTFAPGGAPYSTSNVAGNVSAVGWDGRSVPAGMVHVVSVGVYGRASVTRQALFTFAPGEAAIKYRW